MGLDTLVQVVTTSILFYLIHKIIAMDKKITELEIHLKHLQRTIERMLNRSKEERG